MTFRGINFRADNPNSNGGPADGADDTYCIPVSLSDVYPTTRPPTTGLTFGASAAYVWDARSRTSANDARLNGMAFVSTGGTLLLDLPNGAGTYNIRLAIGDHGGSGTWSCDIKDGATTKFSISQTCAANEFIDASNVVRTAAAWPGSNVTVQHTFSGSQLSVVASGTCRIAHIAIELVTAGGTITADQGSFALTGQTVGLLFNRALAAEYGAYALTGQTATLIYVPAQAFSLTVDAGAYSLTGQAVTLQKDTPGQFTLQVDAGSYSWNGNDALVDSAMNGEQGSYTFNGQTVTFTRGYPQAYSLSVDTGSYTFNGQNARLDWSGAPIVPNRQAGIYMGMRIGL